MTPPRLEPQIRAYLDWLVAHQDEPPPAGFCTHEIRCDTIRACLRREKDGTDAEPKPVRY